MSQAHILGKSSLTSKTEAVESVDSMRELGECSAQCPAHREIRQ